MNPKIEQFGYFQEEIQEPLPPIMLDEQLEKFFKIMLGYKATTHVDEHGMLFIPAKPDIDVAATQAKIDELLAE